MFPSSLIRGVAEPYSRYRPSYGQKLNGNVALTQQVWDDTAATLQLTKPPVIEMNATAPVMTAKPAEPKAETSPQHDMAL
jgi:malate dehydrogenase (quinone)